LNCLNGLNVLNQADRKEAIHVNSDSTLCHRQ
jgi:hypothetical protein